MDNQLKLKCGDAIKVYQKISEGKKDRVIAFQGKIIKSKGNGSNQMLTVRQFVDGVDVDRLFPLSAPSIVKVENIEIKEKKNRKKASKKTVKTSKKLASKK